MGGLEHAGERAPLNDDFPSAGGVKIPTPAGQFPISESEVPHGRPYPPRWAVIGLLLFCAAFWIALYAIGSWAFGATLEQKKANGAISEAHRSFAIRTQARQPASANAVDRDMSTPAMVDGADAAPPFGYISFCMQNLDVCTRHNSGLAKVDLDARTWQLLVDVNDRINASITYRTDREQFGVANRWSLNAVGAYGDCKDYALAKRQALLAAGLPDSAVRMAIVRTAQGKLHALLTVDTDAGTFVLDSLTSVIRPWWQTDYAWLERQSSDDPLRWVRLVAATK